MSLMTLRRQRTQLAILRIPACLSKGKNQVQNGIENGLVNSPISKVLLRASFFPSFLSFFLKRSHSRYHELRLRGLCNNPGTDSSSPTESYDDICFRVSITLPLLVPPPLSPLAPLPPVETSRGDPPLDPAPPTPSPDSSRRHNPDLPLLFPPLSLSPSFPPPLPPLHTKTASPLTLIILYVVLLYTLPPLSCMTSR